MGYTHHVKRPKKKHSDETWTKFISDCIDVKNNLPEDVVLGDGYGEKPDPIFDNTEVFFNGMHEDAHETFQIKKAASSGDFCKTARKPYDLMVCACLLLYKHHFPYVQVSSDGDLDDWREAIALVVETCPKTKTDLTTLLLENDLEWLER